MKFVAEYMRDLNATKAVKRCGFNVKNPENIGCRMLAQPDVRAEVDRRLNERAKRLEISSDNIARELGKIAFATSEDYYDEAGKLLAWDMISPRAKSAIESIEMDPDGNIRKLKLHGKREALVDLGKHIGMYRQVIQLEDARTSPEQQALADQARQKFMGMLDNLAGLLAAKAPPLVDQPRTLTRTTNGAAAPNGKAHA